MTGAGVPRVPERAWLEARFGADSLWRPAAADLPPELTDEASREFLTTIGFPAATIDLIAFRSTSLADGEAMHAFDADELFGRRQPDDDAPPSTFCFWVGTWWDQELMLDAATGGVDHYDPSGWDHGEGYQGPAAASLAALAGQLGLLSERREALASDDTEVRDAAVADLRDRLREFDAAADESSFWNAVFEHLSE
ncbi:SUKH-4 family immunity protein [Glycomyces sp. NPDC049804]|uniref:SUKH-4 family immunity protein n=1 Tax=Glycomyces sp. NPDC049804 TaxID=3154363 RepID=UPI0034195E1A